MLSRSLIPSFSGSLEFVNVAAEVGVFLFNMNNCVFVKEQLMSVSLKQKMRAHMNPYARMLQLNVGTVISPTSSQGSTRSTVRSNRPLRLSCSRMWALPSPSSPLVTTTAKRSSSSSYSTIRKVCKIKRLIVYTAMPMLITYASPASCYVSPFSLKSSFTASEHLVFTDLQWMNSTLKHKCVSIVLLETWPRV